MNDIGYVSILYEYIGWIGGAVVVKKQVEYQEKVVSQTASHDRRAYTMHI